MELFTYALLATVLAMVVVQNLDLLVGLMALQALLLGAGAVWLGWQDGDPALYFAAALTVSIKAVVIPLFLVLPRLFGFLGLYLATVLSDVPFAILAAALLRSEWKQLAQPVAEGGAADQGLPARG
jgi:hydrogenase-4 membrane subunit HyfE